MWLKQMAIAIALQSVAGLASAAVGDPELIGDYQTVRTTVGTPLLDEFDRTFGTALAFSNGRLAVGAADEFVAAAEDIAGAVYVYETDVGGQLRQVARLTEPTPDRYRRFGNTVGMDGDWLAVSAPSTVYVYRRGTNGVWVLQQTLTRTDGAVGGAIAMKGNFLVIGGSKTQQGGMLNAVHLYKLVNGSWVPRTSITSPAGASDASFGATVSVVKDRILVGSPIANVSAGVVYVFEPDATNNWRAVATLSSSSSARLNFGRSVSLNADRCIIGIAGAAEIFDRDVTGNWSRTATLLSPLTEADDFGRSVAIKANRAIVGAPDASGMGPNGVVSKSYGAAYVFKQTATGDWRQVSRVGAIDDATGPAKTGSVVAIAGPKFAISAPRGIAPRSGYMGRVAIFEEGNFGRDFGDAPEPYPTLRANNGARHAAGKLWLGSSTPDREPDGQPDPDALGDNYDGLPDEDGIAFPDGDLVPGALNRLQAYVGGAPGILDVWIDYNRDGDWNDEGEYVLKHRNVQPGRTNFRLSAIPSGYSLGKTFVRARLSTAGIKTPTGPADDGEVEDLAVNISQAVVSAPATFIATEGSSWNMLIQMNRTLDVPVSIQYETVDGTAVAPGDYAAVFGSVVIPSGANQASIPMQSNADAIPEGDETFKLKLTSISGAVAGQAETVITIRNRN